MSGSLYGRSSPYFLPHNLYYDLRIATFGPSICQVLALSRITGYRFEDWLRVFGFDIEDITRLQVQLPSNRTILLDPAFEDRNSWVPWFRSKAGHHPVPPIAPLSQWLEVSHPRRLHSFLDVNRRTFLYVRIGQHDAFAFPDLLPGSIVRVDPRSTEDHFPPPKGTPSDKIFLIEHGTGLYCSRLHLIGDNRVELVNAQLPHPETELQLPQGGRIRGVVDLEVRSLVRPEPPHVPRQSANSWVSEPFPQPTQLGHLLRGARTRMALSFRQASAISRQIADLLGDEQYFISASSLSDYETRHDAPRHIQKIIALCSFYAVDLFTFLRTAGLALDEGGSDWMPDHLLPRPLPPRFPRGESETGQSDRSGFLEQLLGECEEVPFFLRQSLGVLSNLPHPSLHDFFWIGGERDAIHPYLADGLLVVVNRRKKKPRCSPSKPPWQHPLYVLLQRDGTYVCGCCGVAQGRLAIYPFPQQAHRPRYLRHPYDAEVVGQIVTIVRKLA
jgi:transcriptional regulator with XRE-family HTH domain